MEHLSTQGIPWNKTTGKQRSEEEKERKAIAPLEVAAGEYIACQCVEQQGQGGTYRGSQNGIEVSPTNSRWIGEHHFIGIQRKTLRNQLKAIANQRRFISKGGNGNQIKWNHAQKAEHKEQLIAQPPKAELAEGQRISALGHVRHLR